MQASDETRRAFELAMRRFAAEVTRLVPDSTTIVLVMKHAAFANGSVAVVGIGGENGDYLPMLERATHDVRTKEPAHASS